MSAMAGNVIRKRLLRNNYLLCDFIVSFLVWLAVNIYRFYQVGYLSFSSIDSYMLSRKVLFGQLVIPLIWLVVYYYSGYYNSPLMKSRLSELSKTFFSTVVGSLLIFFVLMINDLPRDYKIYYKLLFMMFVTQFFCIYVVRAFMTGVITRKIHGRQIGINTLVIGVGRRAVKLTEELDSMKLSMGFFIKGCIDMGDCPVAENAKVLGCKSDLEKIIKDQNIKEIILAPEQETDETVLAYIRALYRFGLPIKMSVSSFLLTKSVRMSTIYASPMIDINKDNMPEGQKNIKNTFDRLAAALFLVLFSPLYLYLAWRVKRDSPGGIFYRQERLGLHGKPFTIYKFRTMRQDAEASGPALSSENDPRITPFGHVMRKYRFDELPQFWNVLKGDMSLVGPRPERSFYAEQIMEKAPFYCQVYTVKPGITSWGMVKYGYAKTVDQMTERLKYDIIYLDNRSLFIDIKILIYTVRTIVTGKGI